MIVLSNTEVQTIPAGQSVVFDVTKLHTGCGECHRKDTGIVKLRAEGATYELSFSANLSSPSPNVPVSLAIYAGEGILPETNVIAVPSGIDRFYNVSVTTAVKNCCDLYDTITVRNTGTGNVIVGENPVLFIRRLA